MTIREERYALELKIEDAIIAHNKKMLSLRKKIDSLSTKCEHIWGYNPDPSGNNDSSYTCSECRKEVRRIP